MERKVGLTFACMNLKKLARRIGKGGRKNGLSFVFIAKINIYLQTHRNRQSICTA